MSMVWPTAVTLGKKSSATRLRTTQTFWLVSFSNCEKKRPSLTTSVPARM